MLSDTQLKLTSLVSRHFRHRYKSLRCIRTYPKTRKCTPYVLFDSFDHEVRHDLSFRSVSSQCSTMHLHVCTCTSITQAHTHILSYLLLWITSQLDARHSLELVCMLIQQGCGRNSLHYYLHIPINLCVHQSIQPGLDQAIEPLLLAVHPTYF